MYALWVFNNSPLNVSVHYCSSNSWSETGITWNNAPSFSPTPSDVVSVSDEEQWYTWDITDNAKNAIGNENVTVVLKVQSTGRWFTTGFYSIERNKTPLGS